MSVDFTCTVLKLTGSGGRGRGGGRRGVAAWWRWCGPHNWPSLKSHGWTSLRDLPFTWADVVSFTWGHFLSASSTRHSQTVQKPLQRRGNAKRPSHEQHDDTLAVMAKVRRAVKSLTKERCNRAATRSTTVETKQVLRLAVAGNRAPQQARVHRNRCSRIPHLPMGAKLWIYLLFFWAGTNITLEQTRRLTAVPVQRLFPPCCHSSKRVTQSDAEP